MSNQITQAQKDSLIMESWKAAEESIRALMQNVQAAPHCNVPLKNLFDDIETNILALRNAGCLNATV